MVFEKGFEGETGGGDRVFGRGNVEQEGIASDCREGFLSFPSFSADNNSARWKEEEEEEGKGGVAAAAAEENSSGREPRD